MKLRVFLLSFILFAICNLNAEEFPELKLNYPAYSATITAPGNLIINTHSGEQIFREMYSVFLKGGKPFFEYNEKFNWSVKTDMEKRYFIYTCEQPGKFRFEKHISLQPQNVKVVYYFTKFSEDTLNAAEYSVLLPGENFGGKEYRINDGKIEGRFPLPGVNSATDVLERKVFNASFENYRFIFMKESVTLLDSRRYRWSKNSFRFQGVRGGGALKKDATVEMGFEVSIPVPVNANTEMMEVMQVVKFTPLDLRDVVNMGFQENSVANDGKGGWTDEGAGGNDFRNFPVGRQLFAGVPFTIIDPLANAGRSCIVLRALGKPQFPEAVKFAVNQPARSLYFLHTSAFGSEKHLIGGYRIHYSDGTSTKIELENGQNVFDWWKPKDLPDAVVGWQGAAPKRSPVGIAVFGWNNPQPQKTISYIEFYSNNTMSVPILAGVTISNQQVALVRQTQKEIHTNLKGWKAFSVFEKPLPVKNSAIDASANVKVHAPAGKYGFVRVRNGRFEYENGKRARFFGVALVGEACFPEKPQAEDLAEHLAELGCNIVRIHLYDDNGYTSANRPRSNIFGSGADSSELSAKRMEQFDYFFAKLKEQGIYIYLDLQSARFYTEKDGVIVGKRDKYGNSEENRGIYFDPATIKARKKFAEDLLLHQNPYTNLRYIDDPAIALIDMANENSIFLYDVWRKIDGTYLEQYTALWNRWLLKKYGNVNTLSAHWKTELASTENPALGTVKAVLPVGQPLGGWGGKDTPRLTDGTQFAEELQTNANKEMYRFLRKLGMKCPITGSQPLFLNPPDIRSAADLDFVDLHPYFFGTRPMLQGDFPDYDTISQIALARVKDKPLTVTEWNYHNKDIFPWRNDAPVFVAAYAALQDVDCLIAHSYSGTTKTRTRIEWNQEFHNDPVFIGQWPVASNVFLRGDVSAAVKTAVAAAYTNESIYQRKIPQPLIGFNAFRHKLVTLFNQSHPVEAEPANYDKAVVSDTEELIWHRTAGVFFVDTQKTQAIIGRLDRAAKSSNSILQVYTDSVYPASIVLSSMDGKDLKESSKILLTACGRCENTGMRWDSSRCKAIDRGRGPIMIEPVHAKIVLKGLPAAAYKISALKNDGTIEKTIPFKVEKGNIYFSLDADTIYYAINKDI